MNRYDVLLFMHIALAVVWVGGGFMIQLFALRATAAGGERAAGFLEDVEWIGSRILAPASLFAFVIGPFLVLDSPWSFGDHWIVIGLVLFGITFFAGSAFFGPESGRIANLVAEHELDSPEAQRRIGRLLLFSRLDLVLLFLIIYEMAVKPDFGEPATIVVGLAGFVVAAGLVVWRALAGRSSPVPAGAD